MTLGLPNHLIVPTMSRVLALAAHWFGLVCLGGALTAVIALNAAHPYDGLWPTIIALVPMALLLVTLTRHHTVLATVGYLVVGAASTYVYAITILSDPLVYPSTDMFVIALPVMALVMVGGAGVGPLIGLVWSTVGLVLGESAIALAALSTGSPYRPGVFAPATYLLLVVVLVASALNRNRSRAAQPLIHRASRRDGILAARRTFASRATAVVHDTALSHLVALSAAEPGPIDPRLRSMISRDLERLVGQDWLLTRAGPARGGADWASSPVAEAIDEARAQGLVIAVSGDRRPVLALDPHRAEALGLAVSQCLVNVLRHSGVREADLTVSASETEVAVTVTDAGDGFQPSDTSTASIGLRQSVFARIEEVGGTARIWSTPGTGTSVILVVPASSTPSSTAAGGSLDDVGHAGRR